MAFSVKGQHALGLLVVMLVLVGVVLPSAGSGTASAAEGGVPAAAEGGLSSAPDQTQPAILEVGQQSLGEQRSPEEATATSCGSTGCPTAPSGLNYCVERTNFCVYYTTDSISETQAEWAADVVQDYWDRFLLLGFDAPSTAAS